MPHLPSWLWFGVFITCGAALGPGRMTVGLKEGLLYPVHSLLISEFMKNHKQLRAKLSIVFNRILGVASCSRPAGAPLLGRGLIWRFQRSKSVPSPRPEGSWQCKEFPHSRECLGQEISGRNVEGDRGSVSPHLCSPCGSEYSCG